MLLCEERKTDAECLRDYGVLPCINCSAMDFRDDTAHGCVVCMGCGLVQDQILCVESGYDEHYTVAGDVYVNTARCAFSSQAFRTVHQNKKSLPYKRQTYFNERLSQWQGLEPEIPEDDAYAIKQVWQQFAPDAWPDDWQTKPSKDRIGAVLSSLDLRLAERGERPRFVRVYYEKWLTIRKQLTGHTSWGEVANKYLVRSLQEHFDRLQEPYDKRYRERFGRHSMISYNFIIRRLLELHGCTHMIEDFPPLKTTNKQRMLKLLWRDLCGDMKWPYINNDARVFPHAIKLKNG